MFNKCNKTIELSLIKMKFYYIRIKKKIQNFCFLVLILIKKPEKKYKFMHKFETKSFNLTNIFKEKTILNDSESD
jgi:hypothetical protein